MALPIAHLTKGRWFEVIVDQAKLEPQPDKHFKKNILYFFYGGVFYRPRSQSYEEEIELPIAFVFDPSALAGFSHFYPFDTGAMLSDLFKGWRAKMPDFEETFKVNGADYTVPKRMVYHLFGDNEQYLLGRPAADLKTKPDPLPTLFDFLRDNLTVNNTDQRQYCIECQAVTPLAFDRSLVWIGYPEYYTSVFLRLLEKLKPYVPQTHRYKTSRIFNPRELAARLEDRAREAVIERYVSQPRIP